MGGNGASVFDAWSAQAPLVERVFVPSSRDPIPPAGAGSTGAPLWTPVRLPIHPQRGFGEPAAPDESGEPRSARAVASTWVRSHPKAAAAAALLVVVAIGAMGLALAGGESPSAREVAAARIYIQKGGVFPNFAKSRSTASSRPATEALLPAGGIPAGQVPIYDASGASHTIAQSSTPATTPVATSPKLVTAPTTGTTPITAPVPTTTLPPGNSGSSSGSGSAAVEKVAQEVIAAVNSDSNGQYSISATSNNVLLLERWMGNEGGLWANNPLNTSLYSATYPHQIATDGTDTGIPIFPNMQVGVDATARTLLLSSYTNILNVLAKGNASCTTFAKAVIASPWAASHYGHDPSAFCNVSPPTGTGGGKHRRHGGSHPARHGRNK